MNAGQDFIPTYKLLWADEFCQWSVQPSWPPRNCGTEEAKMISVELPTSFEIIPPGETLDSLSICLSNFYTNTIILIELFDEDGRKKSASYVKFHEVFHRKICNVLSLAGIKFTAGASQTVRLTSSSQNDDRLPAIWGFVGKVGRYDLRRRLDNFKEDRVFSYSKPHAKPPHCSRVVLMVADPFSHRTSTLYKALTNRFSIHALEIAKRDISGAAWEDLEGVDLIFFDDAYLDGVNYHLYSTMCFALRRRGVCTVLLRSTGTFKEFSTSQTTVGEIDFTTPNPIYCEYILDFPGGFICKSLGTASGTMAALECINQKISLDELVTETGRTQFPSVCLIVEGDVRDPMHLLNLERSAYNGELNFVIWACIPSSEVENDAIENALLRDNLRLKALGAYQRSICVIKSDLPILHWPILAAAELPETDLYIFSTANLPIDKVVSSSVFEHSFSGAHILRTNFLSSGSDNVPSITSLTRRGLENSSVSPVCYQPSPLPCS